MTYRRGAMKKIYYSVLMITLIMIMLFSVACSKKQTQISKNGFFFDTYITITLYDTTEEQYLTQCMKLCEYYQSLFDKNSKTSDIYRLNHANGNAVSVEQETFDIIEYALSYAEKSNGIFDITIGSLSGLWDITNRTTAPDITSIHTALKSVDYHSIKLYPEEKKILLENPDTKLDLGGIAKGYIADKIKEYLLSNGIQHGLINLGGNILLLNDKPNHENYQIGIQKPFGKIGETAVTVSVSDKSIVTSGVYQRYFYENDKFYHHILDVMTGYPVETDLYGVTIISDTSVLGDSLSTICLSLGLEKGMAYLEQYEENVEAIFITQDQKIHLTSGLKLSNNTVSLK